MHAVYIYIYVYAVDVLCVYAANVCVITRTDIHPLYILLTPFEIVVYDLFEYSYNAGRSLKDHGITKVAIR